jgi:hypothetical protein
MQLHASSVPARSALTSGTARKKRWVLHFDRRTLPVIEPLMGWTGGDDTLYPGRVYLSDSRGSRRLCGAARPHLCHRRTRWRSACAKPSRDQQALRGAGALFLARMQARRDPCNLSKTPDLKRALVNPAAVFRASREIVDQSSFEHRLQAGTAHPLGLGRVSAAARERRGHAGRARVLASRRGQTRAPRPQRAGAGRSSCRRREIPRRGTPGGISGEAMAPITAPCSARRFFTSPYGLRSNKS